MARPRAKKKKVSSGTHTRSVFLYGSPNAEKRSTLEKLQADYTDAVNFYISLLSDREECLLQLLQNDKKDPLLRKLEKESRMKSPPPCGDITPMEVVSNSRAEPQS